MKKGSIKYVLWFVVAAFALLLAILFLRRVFESTNQVIDDSECANEIKTHVTMMHLTDDRQARDIYCPTKYLTLDGRPDELKRQIAELMRKEWTMWYQGKENLFGKDAENVFCHIYAVIDFKKKNFMIQDFQEYIVETKMPPPNEDTFYADYFSGHETPEAGNLFNKAKAGLHIQQIDTNGNSQNITINYQGQEIDTSKRYAIMFYYNKDHDKIEEFMKDTGTVVAGGAAGATVGGTVFGVIGGTVGAILCAPTLAGAAACAAGGAKIGAAMGAVVGGFVAVKIAQKDDPEWLSFILLREYESDDLAKMGCEIAPAIQKKRDKDVG